MNRNQTRQVQQFLDRLISGSPIGEFNHDDDSLLELASRCGNAHIEQKLIAIHKTAKLLQTLIGGCMMIAQSDTWPEDEAQMTALQYRGLIQDDGLEHANNWLERQTRHMEGVFGNDTDFNRYKAELDFLTK
jgi:tellurite resistance protein